MVAWRESPVCHSPRWRTDGDPSMIVHSPIIPNERKHFCTCSQVPLVQCVLLGDPPLIVYSSSISMSEWIFAYEAIPLMRDVLHSGIQLRSYIIELSQMNKWVFVHVSIYSLMHDVFLLSQSCDTLASLLLWEFQSISVWLYVNWKQLDNKWKKLGNIW